MTNLLSTGKTNTVLAVGASGKFAGLVIPELAKRGAKVRGLVRKSNEGNKVLAKGAAEIAIGDLTDSGSISAALAGVDAVFYIAPAFLPNEAAFGRAMVAAAKKAGVRRFVFSSVIHPILSELINHAAKAPVEEAVLTSGMEYTFLHPAMFFQNFGAGWSKVAQTGTLAEPWSTETRFSRVDFRDVAEVAAIALTEDRLNYGTYELCAEGHLNRQDVAELISGVLGRKIQAEKLDLNAGPNAAKPDDGQMASLKLMFDWYDRHALLGNALILRAILGREPRSLRAYFEELAQGTANA